MRRVRVAFAAGVAALALALGLTLSGSPASVARTTEPRGVEEEPIASTEQGQTYCQGHEVLPAGVTAIRVWLFAAAGPALRLTVSAGGRLLASGRLGSHWLGGSATIPVKPLSRAVSGATLCVSFRLADETVIVQGSPAPAALAAYGGGIRLHGRMWVEDLRPGHSSWASLIPAVVCAMGLGRAQPGAWVALLVLALMASVAALAALAVLRGLR
ncbi:MAG TPA: hypothetical protein VMD79_13190 [Solirubrobacteraceae bacterium]|nr:hypothetical protein [Solirubrobacteraceae bacterium]